MTAMTTPAPSAGWYPAPDGQPYQRWWDGHVWGEQTRPLPAAAGVGFPAKAVTYEPVRTSHLFHLVMSILTCGLWAVFVWFPMTVLNSISRRRVVTRYQPQA